MYNEVSDPRFSGTFYHRSGQGFPIFLIHGFGEDSRIWENQLKLTERYTVYKPDLPGSGNSALLDSTSSIDELAAWILAILDQEGLDQVIMLGHSMGGYITLAFAHLFPERLKAFGLLHSTAFADDEAKIENRRKSIKLIENDGKDVFLKAMIPNLYSEQSRKLIPEIIQSHLAMSLNLDSKTLIAYYQAMIYRLDRSETLLHTNSPVLFVIGEDDQVILLAQSLMQCHLPKVSKVKVMQGIGHTSMNECPEELNECLINFCDEVLNIKIA